MINTSRVSVGKSKEGSVGTSVVKVSLNSNESSTEQGPVGREVDRQYLEGVINRSRRSLQFMLNGVDATSTTEIQYLIQRTAPAMMENMDKAQALISKI